MTNTVEELQKDKKNFLWLFLSLFLLGIFFLGGTYAFVILQKPSKTQEPINNQTATNQKEIHALGNTLDSVQQKDLQKDFTQINQELKNL